MATAALLISSACAALMAGLLLHLSEAYPHDCGFKCTITGECLAVERTCDGVDDCGDNSDEADELCRKQLACVNMTVCQDSQCTNTSLSCISKVNCTNGSDEKNCSIHTNNTCRFRCKNGECIDEENVCDGKVHCEDGSDETADVCSRQTCPPYAVRCQYGGCIDGNMRCDGHKDCMDGSDEEGCSQSGAACNDVEFQCGDGVCVSDTLRCDGQPDCADGSDETAEQCKNIVCPPYVFKCDYGGCIDKDNICDGTAHCSDGSDEDVTMCASVERRPNKCLQHAAPENGFVSEQNNTAIFSCQPHYELLGVHNITCANNGTWLGKTPVCKEVSKGGASVLVSAYATLLLLIALTVIHIL